MATTPQKPADADAQRAPAARRDPLAARAPLPRNEAPVILVLALIVLVGASVTSAWFASRRTRMHETALCDVLLKDAQAKYHQWADAQKISYTAHAKAVADQCDQRVLDAEAALRERILGAMGDPR